MLCLEYYCYKWIVISAYPADIYLLKVNNETLEQFVKSVQI